jgi:hypothetical protein
MHQTSELDVKDGNVAPLYQHCPKTIWKAKITTIMPHQPNSVGKQKITIIMHHQSNPLGASSSFILSGGKQLKHNVMLVGEIVDGSPG